MSGSNQFLPFAIGSGANTLTPAAYAALTPLVNLGFQSGVAQSVQFNTVLRQCAFVASAIAQFIANQGPNALDDGNQSEFVANLTSAIASSIAGTYLTAANAATTYAPIASPALTGNPTAPTQTAGDSSTKVSTTAFVATAITAALVTAASAAAATQIGIGQTWQNLTASRANGTTYTNSTAKPILVSITTGTNATTNHTITVGGVVAQQAATNPNATTAWVMAIVPPGATYVASSNGTMSYWAELR